RRLRAGVRPGPGRHDRARRGTGGAARRACARARVTPGEVAQRLERLTGTGGRDLQPPGSAHPGRYHRAAPADGRAVLAQVGAAGLAGLFDAEARGLRWLGEAGAVPVPGVAGWDEATLVVSWVAAGQPGAAAAERFGRDLAHMHGTGAPSFGTPWPGFI